MGPEVAGNEPVFRHYAGGLTTYLMKAAVIVADGFEGFLFWPAGERRTATLLTADLPGEFVGSTLHLLAARLADLEGKSDVVNVA